MCRKIRCDKESENFVNFFELNKALAEHTSYASAPVAAGAAAGAATAARRLRPCLVPKFFLF